jgi:hypothetical protein
MEPVTLTPAEKHYQRHLKSVSNYQKRNPEKMREKCKKYLERMKEDPEKYKSHLEKKREYYLKNKKVNPPVEEKVKSENI